MLKRPKIYKTKRINKSLNIKIDYKAVLFFTLLICGIIIGVFIAENGSEEWHSFFNKLITSILSKQSNNSFIIIFLKNFLPFFIILLSTYIIGLCGVGIPLLATVPFITGVMFGVIISQYYVSFGLSGIGCCALIYLPLYATATATLIRSCCCSFDISGEIFLYLVSGKGCNKPLLKEYSLKQLVFLIPIAIGACVTALSYHFFSDLFIFTF